MSGLSATGTDNAAPYQKQYVFRGVVGAPKISRNVILYGRQLWQPAPRMRGMFTVNILSELY